MANASLLCNNNSCIVIRNIKKYYLVDRLSNKFFFFQALYNV